MALFLFTIIGLISVGIVWYGLMKNTLPSAYTPTTAMVWWGIMRETNETDLIGVLIGITFYTLLALLGEIYFRRNFILNQSAEMFFLRLFLLLLPFQAFRFIALYNTQLGVIATRIAWFSRFAAINALLNIGLYSSAISIRRSGYLMGMGIMASLAIAVMMPFDITQPMSNLLYRSGIDTALALSCLSLEALAVLSLFGVGVHHMNKRYSLLSSALLFIIAGYELSFFGNITLSIIGAILIIIGVVGFAVLIQRIYKWV